MSKHGLSTAKTLEQIGDYVPSVAIWESKIWNYLQQASLYRCRNIKRIPQQRGIRDLDKAVMEMQPDQGCCHPGLLGNSLCHDGLHNFFRLRARVVVELWEQAVPWVGTNCACKEEWTYKAEYQQATYGTRHGFMSHAFGDESMPLQQRRAFRKNTGFG